MTNDTFALVKQQRQQLTTLFEAPTFKMILPRLLQKYGLSPEDFVEQGYLAFSGNQELIRATPESKLRALLESARLGLVPDGRLAVIVPRKRQMVKGDPKSWVTEAKLQTMYQGETEMVRRIVPFRRLHTEVVRLHDSINYEPSALENPIKHSFDPKLGEESRGDMVAVYCYCVLIDGSYYHRMLNKDEVMRARASSKSFKDYPDSSPWTLHEVEMWKKTAVRKLAKDLPRSKPLPYEGPTVDDFLTGTSLVPEQKPARKSTTETLLEKLREEEEQTEAEIVADVPVGVASDDQEGDSRIRPDGDAPSDDSTDEPPPGVGLKEWK